VSSGRANHGLSFDTQLEIFKMRNTILATVVALGLSAVAFGANNPSTPAPAASTAASQSSSTSAKPVDPKMADCQKQAKEKGLKGAEHKKFVAECLKK
jgi:hypothetical protein